MKHVKTITTHDAPARALGDILDQFDLIGWVGFWVTEVQDSLAEWKALVAGGLNDNVDPEDV
jgi:hypothetical protein